MNLRLAATVTCALLVAACAHSEGAPPSVIATRSAETRLAPPAPEAVAGNVDGRTNHVREASGVPHGFLVVAGAIVRRCPALGVLKSNPPAMDDEAAWLSIVDKLARCMNEGQLRAERLEITGGTRAGAIVLLAMAKMGVAQDRVDFVNASDEICDLGEDCGEFAVRVDVAKPADPSSEDVARSF